MSFKANFTTASDLPAETRHALRLMIGQLPIAFALRAGGTVRMHKDEVDATGGYMLEMALDDDVFVFHAVAKQ